MPYPQESFVDTKLLPGSLIHARQHGAATETLLCQLHVLKETGRYDAFKLQWHHSYSEAPEVWPIPNHLLWESDIAKWIEGACYLLHEFPNQDIENAVKELVTMIQSAQQSDGYINIHYTVVDPGKRFTNLRDMHELYTCGHLIEAALAHHLHFHNNDLLNPIMKYVELLCETFGPGESQIHGYPGHPEIELALLRLYHRTSDKRYLHLAGHFIHERGNPSGANGEHYFDYEARRRGYDLYNRSACHVDISGCKWYYLAHKPLVEQETIEGHPVRAAYLLTAAADLVRYDRNAFQIREATIRLWNNMVDRNMYITGGIGAMKQCEGFERDHHLPQGTDEYGCYAETCASIGVTMLAQRILQFDLDHRYADVMELCLYNTVLTAVSAEGRSFSYTNQLSSSKQRSAKRSDRSTASCCPLNLLRLLGSIGGYIYSEHIDNYQASIDVHLYIPNEHKFIIRGQNFTLRQSGDYPWVGQVDFELDVVPPMSSFELRLRIPVFAQSGWQITPEPTSRLKIRKGYLTLPSTYLEDNRKFSIHLPVLPRLVAPHPLTPNADTLTVARGPIIYCVEDIDNSCVEDHFEGVRLDSNCLNCIEEQGLLGDGSGERYVKLVVKNSACKLRVDEITQAMSGLPFIDVSPDAGSQHYDTVDELHFVPFFFRGNRETKAMQRSV